METIILGETIKHWLIQIGFLIGIVIVIIIWHELSTAEPTYPSDPEEFDRFGRREDDHFYQ